VPDTAPPPPEAAPRLDGATVARAATSLALSIVASVGLGVVIGVLAFVIERACGLLDAEGWLDTAMWALLPIYAIVAAIGLGIAGSIYGTQRAAIHLLVDSGVLQRLVQRVAAKVAARTDTRAAVDELAREDADLAGKPLTRKVKALGYRIVAGLGASATALSQPDQAAQLNEIGRDRIGEMGLGVILLSLGTVALCLAAAPIALALL